MTSTQSVSSAAASGFALTPQAWYMAFWAVAIPLALTAHYFLTKRAMKAAIRESQCHRGHISP